MHFFLWGGYPTDTLPPRRIDFIIGCGMEHNARVNVLINKLRMENSYHSCYWLAPHYRIYFLPLSTPKGTKG
ncbi:hypothetical protein NC652_022185 [Populus alba x Populus x berolinensis]|nr:hypothetical protein NC652_022185 [Populus alba x Populus x berolinensis]